jgi:hypothetical protein
MGYDAFLQLMAEYVAANTTKTVTVQSFLDKAGVRDGPAYLTSDITRHLASAVIVYGTVREAGANRHAAEQMQTRFLDWYKSQVPIYKDFEVSDDLLRHRDVVFVGRPKLGLRRLGRKNSGSPTGARFKIDGQGPRVRTGSAGVATASSDKAPPWPTKG